MRRTQVPGHGLLNEGAPFDFEEFDNGPILMRLGYTGTAGEGRGVCSCGAYSGSLPTAAARRRWHNEHKAEATR